MRKACELGQSEPPTLEADYPKFEAVPAPNWQYASGRRRRPLRNQACRFGVILRLAVRRRRLLVTLCHPAQASRRDWRGLRRS
jgi:hypothetical protein